MALGAAAEEGAARHRRAAGERVRGLLVDRAAVGVAARRWDAAVTVFVRGELRIARGALFGGRPAVGSEGGGGQGEPASLPSVVGPYGCRFDHLRGVTVVRPRAAGSRPSGTPPTCTPSCRRWARCRSRNTCCRARGRSSRSRAPRHTDGRRCRPLSAPAPAGTTPSPCTRFAPLRRRRASPRRSACTCATARQIGSVLPPDRASSMLSKQASNGNDKA